MIEVGVRVQEVNQKCRSRRFQFPLPRPRRSQAEADARTCSPPRRFSFWSPRTVESEHARKFPDGPLLSEECANGKRVNPLTTPPHPTPFLSHTHTLSRALSASAHSDEYLLRVSDDSSSRSLPNPLLTLCLLRLRAGRIEGAETARELAAPAHARFQCDSFSALS